MTSTNTLLLTMPFLEQKWKEKRFRPQNLDPLGKKICRNFSPVLPDLMDCLVIPDIFNRESTFRVQEVRYSTNASSKKGGPLIDQDQTLQGSVPPQLASTKAVKRESRMYLSAYLCQMAFQFKVNLSRNHRAGI